MNFKKGLENRFEEANKELMNFDISVEIVIVGGAALILKDIIPRATHDIDVISKISDDIQAILGRYGINNRAATFDQTLGNWLSDTSVIKKYSNLLVWSLSNERLLASRIIYSQRWGDLEEGFKNKNIIIDQKKFEGIIEELFEFCDPNYMRELKENIPMLEKLYLERGWDEKEKLWEFCKRIDS